MITGVQIRMARNALRWPVRHFAEVSGISSSTITRAEADNGVPSTTSANIAAMRTALESAGIEFIGTPENGQGIRLHAKPGD